MRLTIPPRRGAFAAFALLLLLAAPAVAHAGGDRVLRHEFTVNAPVSRVWHLWTTVEGLREWFTPDIEVDLRVGGAIRFTFAPGRKTGVPHTDELPILAYEPQRMLSYRTSAPPQFPTVRDAKSTWSVIHFRDVDGESTHVEVCVYGWQEGAEWDAAYDFFDKANPAVFAKLASAAEAAGHLQSAADAYTAPRSLRHTIDIDAPRAAVWEAIATEEGARQWVAPVVAMDLRVGGTLKSNYDATAAIGDEGTIVNHVLTYEPGRMLSLQYRAPANAPWAFVGEKTWSVMLLEEPTPGRTHLTLTGLGYGEGEEWDKLYAFFEAGNAATLAKLKEVAEAAAGGAPAGRAAAEGDPMALLALMPGGEWIHESRGRDGGLFRSRSVVEKGPADGTFVSTSWLGSEKGMHAHGATQIWREPGTDHVRFQNINELGAVARGRIRLVGTNRLAWEWEQVAPNGTRTLYDVAAVFDGNDRYTFTLHLVDADGSKKPLVEAVFTRVDAAPAEWMATP